MEDACRSPDRRYRVSKPAGWSAGSPTTSTAWPAGGVRARLRRALEPDLPPHRRRGRQLRVAPPAHRGSAEHRARREPGMAVHLRDGTDGGSRPAAGGLLCRFHGHRRRVLRDGVRRGPGARGPRGRAGAGAEGPAQRGRAPRRRARRAACARPRRGRLGRHGAQDRVRRAAAAPLACAGARDGRTGTRAARRGARPARSPRTRAVRRHRARRLPGGKRGVRAGRCRPGGLRLGARDHR